MADQETGKKVWQLYCENTTLHGWAYIPMHKNWLIRLIWLLIIATFFTFAFIITNESFQSWEDEPTITTIKNYSASMTEIPFPTVTVCPQGWYRDRYGFLKGVLDQIDFPCSTVNDQECAKLHKTFDMFFSGLYEAFYKALEENYHKAHQIIKSDEKLRDVIEKVALARVDNANLTANFTMLIARAASGDFTFYNETFETVIKR